MYLTCVYACCFLQLHLFDESQYADKEVKQNRNWLRKRLSVFGILKYKRRKLDASQIEQLRREAVRHVDIFNLFKRGALLLDEVDLILHPLKSEPTVTSNIGAVWPFLLVNNAECLGIPDHFRCELFPS